MGMTNQEAVKMIKQICSYLTSGNPVWRNEPIIEACDIAVKAIEAEPIKHGKWKPFDLTWGRSIYACTNCGEAFEVPTEGDKPMYDYCPNCGAKMNEVEE